MLVPKLVTTLRNYSRQQFVAGVIVGIVAPQPMLALDRARALAPAH